MLQAGATVEVNGNHLGEEDGAGFENGWLAGIVRQYHPATNTYDVQLELSDEDSSQPWIVHLPAAVVRPTPMDDSAVPLSKRKIGEAVDCWSNNVWWSGYISHTFDDKVLVNFPYSAQDEEDYEVLEHKMRSAGEKRVRSSTDWSRKELRWVSEPKRCLPQYRDRRSHGHHRMKSGPSKAPHSSSGLLNSSSVRPVPVSKTSRAYFEQKRSEVTKPRPSQPVKKPPLRETQAQFSSESESSESDYEHRNSRKSRQQPSPEASDDVLIHAPSTYNHDSEAKATRAVLKAHGKDWKLLQEALPGREKSVIDSFIRRNAEKHYHFDQYLPGYSGPAFPWPTPTVPKSASKVPRDKLAVHRPQTQPQQGPVGTASINLEGIRPLHLHRGVDSSWTRDEQDKLIEGLIQYCRDIKRLQAILPHRDTGEIRDYLKANQDAIRKEIPQRAWTVCMNGEPQGPAQQQETVNQAADDNKQQEALNPELESTAAAASKKTAKIGGGLSFMDMGSMLEKVSSQDKDVKDHKKAKRPKADKLEPQRFVPLTDAAPQLDSVRAAACALKTSSGTSAGATLPSSTSITKRTSSKLVKASSMPLAASKKLSARTANPTASNGVAAEVVAPLPPPPLPKPASLNTANKPAAKRPKIGAAAKAAQALQPVASLPLPAAPATPKGRCVIIDNLGAHMTSHTLTLALKALVDGVLHATVASIPLEAGKSYLCGWAAVQFLTPDAALHALQRWQRGLFLSIPACKLARPLLVHWPHWTRAPWGNGRMPGFVGGVETCAHFSQPSSLEFEHSLEWRCLLLQHAAVKRRICSEHATQLAALMHEYSTSAAAAAQEPPPAPLAVVPEEERGPRPASAFLWLKGIPMRGKTEHQVIEEMKLTFEQWTGAPAARLIKDAATNQPTGHALVALSSPEHASFLARDMSEMIFMYAGAPRPLEAKVAVPGPPRGAQAVFGRALQTVFASDIDRAQPGAELIEIGKAKTVEERYAKRLLGLMTRQAAGRVIANQKIVAAREQMQRHHEDVFDKEAFKLIEAYEMRHHIKRIFSSAGRPEPSYKGLPHKLNVCERYMQALHKPQNRVPQRWRQLMDQKYPMQTCI
ncbi:hypothetical protein WJX84_010347 [Apatococcus fuscideae]|uniref:Uncharacterized protein n=1 Tax=Apatococcus fuscideae TaxID=2026836 RepID=A0AAW1TDG5_9CHLO